MISKRPANTPRPFVRVRKEMWLVHSLLILSTAAVCSDEPARKAPATRTENVKEVLHGVEVVDPYRWLEDQRSRETRAWIDTQNEYTRSVLGALEGRKQLEQRLTELMKIDAISEPHERNGRYFFSKRLADQELFVIYLRKGLAGKDEVLIDPHPMSPDRTTSVDLLDVSRDGTLMAYAVRQGGEDEFTVNVLDVEARKDLTDRLPKGRYFGFSIKNDKSGFYYSRHEAEGPRVFYHAMGKNPAGDVQVFGKGYGPEKIISSGLSEDGRYLMIHVFHGSAADRTEIYYQDLMKQTPIVPLVNDLAFRFLGAVAGDRIFLHTNWKSPKGRIVSVDLKHPARERWREVIPERDAVIEDFDPVGGMLVVNYTENASSRLRLYEPTGRHVRDIALPAIGTVEDVGGRWESDEVFFQFSSFHIPPSIYRHELKKRRHHIWGQLKVPIQSERFEVKQVWYTSRDGTRVPMFLMHARGFRLGGSSPGLLSGYGGFNISMTPAFRSIAVVWAEQGGVFAMPSLRGGGEFGEEWHKAGMLEKKQNVFDDFIAAAEWLIQSGYTSASRLALRGSSNGGLLVGAALTQRPELFRAVLCGYPLLDMVRYHKFLVARFWVPEYGSSEDPDEFRYLFAYSPYHRVKPGTKYPAVLFMSGDSDTRVDPLHARKMAALLQSATGSDRPVLLHYDTKSGHVAAKPLSKQIQDLTDELTFLFWQLGVTGASPE